ncbi:MAG: N-6 DNA methylase [Nitrososphaeria archaeon]
MSKRKVITSEVITIDNFKNLLLQELGFSKEGNTLVKRFPSVDAILKVDLDKQELIYPEDKGLKVNERQTCNFKQNENFVVFECVHRLLEKGYKPQHIELEPRWQVGHGASGGRADILIRDNDGKPLLIIECKTWGKEFEDAWEHTTNGSGQLFTYAHQERSTQYLCLYASGVEDNELKYKSYIIAMRDNDDILKSKKEKGENPKAYRDADSAKELHKVWKYTYEGDYATRGIFESDVQPYQIGKRKYAIRDLNKVTGKDIQSKYNEFATILRQHNVSGRENAFDKLVNLFLCKIVDEKNNPKDLQFYWRGNTFDTYFDLIDRLQRLYHDGMREFLKEDVTYIDNQTIYDAFKFFKNDPDATRDKILDYFRQQKYFTNSDFSFLDVHNERLFYQNAEILLEVVRMLQDIRLTSGEQKDDQLNNNQQEDNQLNGEQKGDRSNDNQQNQFLGDMFEFFLDHGFKQTEGQFFTPLPVTRFIILSLPLETVFSDEQNPPKVIDYACGAGHFLTELASQLRTLHPEQDVKKFYSQFYGIEKEYRLSKVAKVSVFMYNQDEINIIYADALARHPDIPEGAFKLLVSNPPYSVKGFLETLPETERARYSLIKTVDPKSYPTNNAVESFFLERAKQLLASHGLAGIIMPLSILSKTDSVYTRVREILLQNFDIVALVELGSGTFGKTGTNTVTLFLRKKDDNPAPADHYRNRVKAWFDHDTSKDGVFADAHLLQAYCMHIGIAFDDYQTFLQSNPSQTILDTEIFREYRRVFDDSGEVKKLREQKSFQQKSVAEQEAELARRFIHFAKEIEREKLYYFVLAYTQPCPVIVVRSPQSTDGMKKFLGYEWSAARGQEGIKYLNGSIDRIETPLFDPEDHNNPEKISTLIRRNFEGQNVSIPESLQPYATVVSLVDLLDFSHVSFDKQVLLTPKSSSSTRTTTMLKSAFTKYPFKKLGEIAKIFRGASPRPIEDYLTDADDGIPWIRIGDVRPSDKFINQTAQKITPAGAEKSRRISKGDLVISNSMSVGRPYISQIDGCIHDGWLMLTNIDTNINKEYLYYILISDYVQSQFQERALGSVVKNLNIERVQNVQIPVLPLDVQAQIVREVEELENKQMHNQEVIKTYLEKMKIKTNKLLELDKGQILKADKLGLHYELITGKRPKGGAIKSGVVSIGGEHIQNGKVVLTDPKYVPKDFAEALRRKGAGVSKYDILMCKDGALSGKTAIVKEDIEAVVNEHVVIIRARNSDLEEYREIKNKYLFYILNTELYKQKLRSIKTGSAQGGINLSNLKDLEIPIPHIEEQRRLVEEIEAIENEIDKLEKENETLEKSKLDILKRKLF